MKRDILRFYFGILILTVTIFPITSCKEEEEENSISNSEAAELIGSVLAIENGGVMKALDVASSIHDSLTPLVQKTSFTECNELVNVQYEFKNSPLAIRQFSSNFDVNVRYNCLNSEPISFVALMSIGGSFSGPSYGASLTVSTDWLLAGISTPLSQPLIISGGVEVSADAEDKLRGIDYNFTVSVNLEEIRINKQTAFFEGGTASVSIKGSGPAGDFNFAGGSFDFDQNLIATITIGGEEFLIDLQSGELVI